MKIAIKTIHFIIIIIIIIFALWLMFFSTSFARELIINPVDPIVAVGEKIIFNVPNAIGDLVCHTLKGKTKQKMGAIIYQSPDINFIDTLTVQDSSGNSASVSIVILEKEYLNSMFSNENAKWTIYYRKTKPNALLLSDDEKTLWAATAYNIQERDSINGQIKKIYTKIDELSIDAVTTLLSDGEGGMWIGTNNSGLAHLKFDGTLDLLNKENSDLPGNSIVALISDNKGGLWIGTYNLGLAHLKFDGTWDLLNKENSDLPDDSLESLLPDGQEGIWIGTYRAGLVHLKFDGTWKVFTDYNSDLPYNHIKTIISDGKGGIWVDSYGDYLAHLMPDNTWGLLDKEHPNMPNKYIETLLYDDKEGIWIGTAGGLAHLKFDGSWDVFTENNSDLSDDNIGSLISDREGGIWIGTYDGLVHIKADDTWESVRENYRGDTPSCFQQTLIDSPDGLWVRGSGGIAHLRSNGTWEFLNGRNSNLLFHKSNAVSAFIPDNKGGMWAGISCIGLAHLKFDGTWEIFNENNSILPSNKINVLSSDGKSGTWIGTDSGIVHIKPDGTWLLLDKFNSGLPENNITSILPDNEGGIWIGIGILYPNDGGLVHLKVDETWDIFDKFNSGLPISDVQALLSDNSGGIWIGTIIGLAHLKSTGTWEVLHNGNSDLPGNDIVCLENDNQGGIWVGISRSGIAHLKSDGSWEIFNEENSGLPNDEVKYIQSDGQGGIWVDSINGTHLVHLNYASNIIENELYLTGQRAAIVIAAGTGNTKENILWDSTAKISNYIYKMLKKRGFLDTDIYYISSENWADFNDDYLDDDIVDAPTPNGEVKTEHILDAFNWAENRGKLNQPLYIFFTGYYGNSPLQLSKDSYMEVAELKKALDTYQQKSGNKAILTIDTSHSGILLQSLTGPDRAVITSTDDGFAYIDRDDGQGFIYFLSKGLYRGMNYFDAFHYALDNQKKMLGYQRFEDTMVIEDNIETYAQNPQYDDTGDGIYEKEVDGIWLKDITVNGHGKILDNNITIKSCISSEKIKTHNRIHLKAQASIVSGEILRVWAVIRPPQMDIDAGDLEIPIMTFPKVALNASKIEADVWEGVWNGFVYNGEYEITFYAEDNQKDIESSDSVMVSITDGLECPLNASVKVISNKEVYSSGDYFKISFSENLSYGYDLYLALVMPDGRFVAFCGMNQICQEFNRSDSWWSVNRHQGNETVVVEINKLESIAKGEYCVYAILSPERQYVFDEVSNWIVDSVCFKVE